MWQSPQVSWNSDKRAPYQLRSNLPTMIFRKLLIVWSRRPGLNG